MPVERRFVIVDGNRNFHNLLRGVLRTLGWRKVDSFYDGAEALGHLEQMHVDVAFTDVQLVGGRGVDFIHEARHKRLANPHMPIVLLTSLTSKQNIEDAVSAGADLVLAKPISPKLMYDRITTLLDREPNYIETASGYYGPDPEIRLRRRLPARPAGPVFPAFDEAPPPMPVYVRPRHEDPDTEKVLTEDLFEDAFFLD